jgi:flagellin
MLTINTNSAAKSILSNLNNVENQMNTSYQQLSTGNQVNSAADNPASYAISQQMTSQVNGLNQATQNAQSGISMIQTATGAMNQIEQVLQTMSTLATESSNTGNTFSDRANLQLEMNALAQQINSTTNQTQYNGISLLTGQFGTAGATGQSSMTLQVGANQGQTLSFNINATDVATLGVGGAQATGVQQAATLSAGTTTVAVGTTSSATSAGIDIGSGVTVGAGISGTDVKLVYSATYTAASTAYAGTLTLEDSSGNIIGTTVTLSSAAMTGSTVTIGNTGTGQDITLNLASDTSLFTLTSTGTNATYAQTDTISLSRSFASGAYTGGTGTAVATNGASTASGNVASSITANNSTLQSGMQLQLVYSANTNSSGSATGGTLQLEDQNGNTIGGAVTLSQSQITNGGNVILGDSATGATLTINLNKNTSLFTGANAVGSYTQTDSFTLSGPAASTTQGSAVGATPWQATTNVAGINILTQTGAQSAITQIQNAINTLSSSQAQLGAVQNRLNYTVSNLGNSAQNLQSAQSTITNTDMAAAYTQFSQQQVLEQVGISMLSQAQQQPQMILKLLQ